MINLDGYLLREFSRREFTEEQLRQRIIADFPAIPEQQLYTYLRCYVFGSN